MSDFFSMAVATILGEQRSSVVTLGLSGGDDLEFCMNTDTSPEKVAYCILPYL